LDPEQSLQLTVAMKSKKILLVGGDVDFGRRLSPARFGWATAARVDGCTVSSKRSAVAGECCSGNCKGSGTCQ
jgi:hypothetical protein